MEFHANSNAIPKNLYPCLAQITVSGNDTKSRRLSSGSYESGGENTSGGGGGVLGRVISGGRRKSSFGATTTEGSESTAAERRMSILPSAYAGGEKGTWYWRVQAGVTETHLVLLPFTQPPNSVLTHPPAPLSQAMPSHSAAKTGTGGTSPTTGKDSSEGVVDKMKNLFRRGSKDEKVSPVSPTGAATEGSALDTSEPAGTAGGGATANVHGHVDRVLDQAPTGEQLPSPSANAMGATNVDANAETGWPGVLQNGNKLGSITVALGGVEKDKVRMGGGKKNESCWVTIPITSHFAAMVHETGVNAPKAGTIRLEFDKDWIGAKGEAELIYHQLTTALSDRADRSPRAANLQLGTGGSGVSGGGNVTHPNPGMAEVHLARGTGNNPNSGNMNHPNPGMQELHRARQAASANQQNQQQADLGGDESVASGTKVAGYA